MYQKLIDAKILERDEARQADRGSDEGEWHPSGLFNCERQAVYNYLGTPVTDGREIRNVRIMDRGTEVHAQVQEWLLEAHPNALVEVPVRYGGVHGSCDALLPISDGFCIDCDNLPSCPHDPEMLEPVYEVQEYKSESPMARRYRKNKPKDDHVRQARTYAECLAKQGYLIAGIRIIYIDRDDWSVNEYEVPEWTPEEAERELWSRIARLEQHVMEGSLPARMPDDFWLCRYCPYFTTCKGAR